MWNLVGDHLTLQWASSSNGIMDLLWFFESCLFMKVEIGVETLSSGPAGQIFFRIKVSEVLESSCQVVISIPVDQRLCIKWFLKYWNINQIFKMSKWILGFTLIMHLFPILHILWPLLMSGNHLFLYDAPHKFLIEKKSSLNCLHV